MKLPTAWDAPLPRAWSRLFCPLPCRAIITGVVLAVARAAGETAPLLFTALFSESWLAPNDPTASLAVLIYNWSSSPYENLIELAWAASLILVVLVFVLNVVSRTLGGKTKL